MQVLAHLAVDYLEAGRSGSKQQAAVSKVAGL